MLIMFKMYISCKIWWVAVREVGAPEKVGALSVKKRPAGNFDNLWVSRFHVQKMTLNDHTEPAMCYSPRRRLRQECMKFFLLGFLRAVATCGADVTCTWWEQNCGKSINSINDQLHTPPLDNCYCSNLMVIPYSHITVYTHTLTQLYTVYDKLVETPKPCAGLFPYLKNCSLPMNNT